MLIQRPYADKRIRAYAIVRRDRSGRETSEQLAQVRVLADRLDFQLRGVLVAESDTDFGRLLATFARSDISALLVPSVLHLTGWLDAVRQDVEVWTLAPLGRWPRRPAPGVAADFLPGVQDQR